MPCHGCAKNFSLFVREYTCSNCKFSFCFKCLRGKISTNEASQRICGNCCEVLKNKISPSLQDVNPPGLLLKCLETLENPAKPPITMYKRKGKLLNLKAGLEPEDKQILERLEKLKEDHKIASPPSEFELNRRLMILKGLNEDKLDKKPQITHPQAKSEEEQVDDLLKQYINEMTLEAFDADDGDFISKKIIHKTIAEGKLEKRLEKSGLMSKKDEDEYEDEQGKKSSDESEDEDETNIGVDSEKILLWCIICNEYANLKCIGCDGSLYCNNCFKQGHEFFEMENHKTIKFK